MQGTPRRLVVLVEKLAAHQPDRQELVKGPPAERAFNPDGSPTSAAAGFARKNGVESSALEVREQDGGKYVFALLEQAGLPALEVLSKALPALVAGIKFEKSMRWNESGVTFSRPLRWFTALLGKDIIPFEYAGLQSGRESRGLRPYNSPQIIIPSAEKYLEILRKNGILVDGEERKELVAEGVKKLAASVKGEALLPAGLLAEVANLVEKPLPLLGGFDAEFLSLPEDVLISVMKKHQRYFPIRGAQGKLLPNFVVVRNGDEQGLDLVRQGNEHVVRARFADADFFVREDLKHTLEEFRPRLGTLVFQKKLGSMLDKNERVEKLTAALIPLLGLQADEASAAQRAAHLLKADLVTKMVVEMTSLQGIIGCEYARRDGETAAVAEAIGEQYQPIPKSKPGLAVAIADRLDSLVGLFAAGLAPSGTKDPFGLRRAAIGVVQPLMEHNHDFDLDAALKAAATQEPLPVTDQVLAQVKEFITGRLKVVLLDMGYRFDVVEAVLAMQANNPARAKTAVHELNQWVEHPEWNTILPGFARCVRITRDQAKIFSIQPASFVEQAEKNLYTALEKAKKQCGVAGSVDDFLKAFVPMIPAVNEFFDKVLVMAEDRAVKENRLGLLQEVSNLAAGTADLSKLEGF